LFVDLLLILEHSFYLFHQKDSQPLLSSAQKYKASNIPKQVKLAMKGVFDQYKKATKEPKVEMLVNVILQNRMSMLSISLIVFLITIYLSNLIKSPRILYGSQNQVVLKKVDDKRAGNKWLKQPKIYRNLLSHVVSVHVSSQMKILCRDVKQKHCIYIITSCLDSRVSVSCPHKHSILISMSS
jgi:hypothetical protein